jgi:glutamate-1-semialdehyde 2,1-aminomutase
MPLCAFGGKLNIMEHISPLGYVYQAGTLSGIPIAMIAGYTLLKELKSNPSLYTELNDKTTYLRNGLDEKLKASGKDYVINQLGSMISIHFSKEPITDFGSASRADIPLFNKLFHFMLDNGIYLPPSAYESWFLNNALSYADLDKTIAVLGKFLGENK